MMQQDDKRLFFGAEIAAPWPKAFPKGREISSSSLHITLAFLGNVSFSSVSACLSHLPKPSFQLGPVAILDKLLFLPEENPRVVAEHASFLTHKEEVFAFQKALSDFLKEKGFILSVKEFLPHLTRARAPFNKEEWEAFFSSLPAFIAAIHLYESVGNLTYLPLWTHPLVPPFQEFSHTADMAFYIRGETLSEIHLHAQLALAFKFPQMTHFMRSEAHSSLDEIIISLNQLLGYLDGKMGIPFKAVSFHGELVKKTTFLEWEMIVDV